MGDEDAAVLDEDIVPADGVLQQRVGRAAGGGEAGGGVAGIGRGVPEVIQTRPAAEAFTGQIAGGAGYVPP